jgi:hypothetical protein
MSEFASTHTAIDMKEQTRATSTTDSTLADYPSLRQIPRLAVLYADIYRRVRIQETFYEMLTQHYELADVPVVRVIDAPGIPEKKSFLPRALFALLITVLILIGTSARILLLDRWNQLSLQDPRKELINRIAADVSLQVRQFRHDPRYRS